MSVDFCTIGPRSAVGFPYPIIRSERVLLRSRMPSVIVIRASGPTTMITLYQRPRDLPRILHALRSTRARSVLPACSVSTAGSWRRCSDQTPSSTVSRNSPDAADAFFTWTETASGLIVRRTHRQVGGNGDERRGVAARAWSGTV